MATKPRGRGYAMQANKAGQPLRRPAESGLKQRFGDNFQINNTEKKEDPIDSLCSKIVKMGLSNPEKELAVIEKDVLSLCDSQDGLSSFVDKIVTHGLESQWNAHAVASFCVSYGDVAVENIKLRTMLLRKLQKIYTERENSYLTLDKFLMDVRFLCEIFFHVKIDGNCIQVLSRPVLDVLGMLVDGGSEKEIEVVYEQFPKCFASLKANNSDGLNNFLDKIRQQLLSDDIPISARTMLLEMFELILCDGKLISDVEKFYKSQSISVVRMCK
ncbi:MIF4G domain-containing protein A [Parasteatoda tepidariorum]|uniref:MIF4G domain-containing protein A n=1 Tax=Parasteatoda tepidariorum TaxID=114398 RepID=UPI00077F91ED|nr:uncharacterized protein LOC107442046 [Parasteatoda tepidariorum]XP_015910987.1 uncharacterized protein LOC107442046 [Parasteatoda tepidariorum]XP_015910988.1 uncharacterized protein LOC107442046 [Parasteatoda tepidariorum]